MSENEMGYRGSKSRFVLNTGLVKEQRIDGSWFLVKKAKSLRYTLMGGESLYPIKIPSNQINNKYYSTYSNFNSTLNPYFITR